MESLKRFDSVILRDIAVFACYLLGILSVAILLTVGGLGTLELVGLGTLAIGFALALLHWGIAEWVKAGYPVVSGRTVAYAY